MGREHFLAGTVLLSVLPFFLVLCVSCCAQQQALVLARPLGVHRYDAMTTRKNNRGTTLLVILQMWILPCHGFTYAPYGLGSSSGRAAGAWSSGVAARQSSFAAMLQRCPPKATATAAVSRETLPRLSMSDAGAEPFDPYADEVSSLRVLCSTLCVCDDRCCSESMLQAGSTAAGKGRQGQVERRDTYHTYQTFPLGTTAAAVCAPCCVR